MLRLVSFLALITGILGASLVSFNIREGFLFFTISAILSCYILRRVDKNLFYLNFVYFFINLNGLYQFYF